jgi:hypothetical protein
LRPVGDGSTGAKRNTAGQPARLDTPAAPRFIGLSYRTLEKYRISGTGPNYSRIKGRVFYAIGELTEWAERGAKQSTSDPGKTTVLGAIPANGRAARSEER